MIVAVVKNQIIASHNVIVGDKQKQLLNYIPQEVILGVFFYYHSKCASNCNICNGSCTSGCNSGCTGSCNSCTGCLTCNGYCNNCTFCYGCHGCVDKCDGYTCTAQGYNFSGCLPCVAGCISGCYRCYRSCYDCNDVYSWCNWFTSGGSCRAGNGKQCSSFA